MRVWRNRVPRVRGVSYPEHPAGAIDHCVTTTGRTLLSGVSSAQLQREPFPHIVVRDALDGALCDALVAQYPPLSRITGRTRWASNQRFSYSASHSLNDAELPDVWRDLVRQHTSQTFLDQVLALLAPAVQTHYPDFEARFGEIQDLRAGVRRIDDFTTADVLLDAQICVNTPVMGRASSVRKGHVDRLDKLFAGLFYLRDPEDTSAGGDLELYRFRPGGERRFNDKYIDDRWIETAATVAYERNVFVLFLNGPWALHGVTPRSPSQTPRLFLNLVGEIPGRLFDLSDRQMPLARLRRTTRLGGDWLRRHTSLRAGS
jgi:hypothetical protein